MCCGSSLGLSISALCACTIPLFLLKCQKDNGAPCRKQSRATAALQVVHCKYVDCSTFTTFAARYRCSLSIRLF